MTDEENFNELMDMMREYLNASKTFIINPDRQREISYAYKLAHELLPDAAIQIVDDPLQMGALIMRMTTTDITIDSDEAYDLLNEIIALTDNFEIYPISNEQLCFAAVFENAFIRLP